MFLATMLIRFTQVQYRVSKYLGDKRGPSTASSSVMSTPRAVLSTNGVTVEQRVDAMADERRMLDTMLSVTQSEKEALQKKSKIISTAERAVTTVRKTIVENVESRKDVAS